MMEEGGPSPFVFDRSMVYDGRPLVAALLYLSGRWRDLPDYAKVSGAGYFIKREPAKQAMAHLRYLAQQHSYPAVAAVLNALYPPACPPVVRLVPVPLPCKHLLGALPLRTDQDSVWLGRPRPYGSDKRAGRALVAEIAKRGWDRDLCLSKHRYTLGFSHRPATRDGEGRNQTFPLFVPAASAGEEERALSWDTLAGAADPGVEGKPDFHALLELARGQQQQQQQAPLFPQPPEASDEEEEDDDGSKDGGDNPSPSHTAVLQPLSQASQGQGQETTTMATRTRRRGRPRTTRAEGPSSPFPAFPAPLAHPPDWAAGFSDDEEEEDDGDNGYASPAPSPASLPLKKRPRTAATAPPASSSSSSAGPAPVNPPPAVVRQPSAAAAAAVVVVKGTGGQGKGKKGRGKGKGAEAGADATARSSGTSTSFLKQLFSASLFNALWSHLSDRETSRGASVSENTVTTYLCGIRVFLDLPGVVALPPHKLNSKAELRKYILRSGDGLFTQWAQKGFKTKSAVNQLLEFAGLFQTYHAKPSAADAGPTHAGQSKLCVYSDEAKQAAHLLATFWLPNKPSSASSSSSSTTTTIPRPITAPPPSSASGPVTKKTKKGAGGVGTKRGGTDTERLDALAFVAAMVSPLPTKKQRKLARGLGPYAQSDYSSSSEEEEEEGELWGEAQEGKKVALVALAAAAGGSPTTCKAVPMEM